MARKTFGQKVSAIDAEIAELVEKKKELCEKQEQARKAELIQIIEKSGMSVDELRELVEQAKRGVRSPA